MSDSTVGHRHAREQRIFYADPYLSPPLRAFRRATEGLSQTFPLRGCESMRLGRQPSPHQHVQRFLDAGARLRLGRKWALDFLAFIEGEIGRLFPIDHTPRRTLRARAHEAAAAHRAAELESLVRGESTGELRAEAEALQESIGASGHLLAVIRAELADRSDG